MLFFLIPLSVIILAGIIFIAVSPKSEPMVRRAAIIALAVIGVAVIASLILIFSQPVKVINAGVPGLPAVPAKDTQTTSMAVLIFSIFFLLFIAGILYIAFSRQKKQEAEKTKALKKEMPDMTSNLDSDEFWDDKEE
jgi:cbb3-type cytochrome oxidase subunit 3